MAPAGPAQHMLGEPQQQQAGTEHRRGRHDLHQRRRRAQMPSGAQKKAQGNAKDERDQRARTNQFERDRQTAGQFGGGRRRGGLADAEIEMGEGRQMHGPGGQIAAHARAGHAAMPGRRQCGDGAGQKERACKSQNQPRKLAQPKSPHTHMPRLFAGLFRLGSSCTAPARLQ